MPPTRRDYEQALAEIGDPIDAGLTVYDWACVDPEGYEAAVQVEFDGETVAKLGSLIAEANAQHQANVSGLEERMKERLRGEVARNAAWIEVWREGRK